jgi:Ty3 transposon peptidase
MNRMIGSDDEEIVMTHEEREKNRIMSKNYVRYGVLGDDKKRVVPWKKTGLNSEPLVVENRDFGETQRQEDLSQNDEPKNVKINKVILDSYSCLSFVSRACAKSLRCPIDKGPPVKGVGINGKSWESQEYVVLKLKLLDSIWVEHKFLVLDGLPTNMVMGLDICRKLPLMVTLDGQTSFKGFKEIRSSYASPTVVVGKGINFVDRSDKERRQVRKF